MLSFSEKIEVIKGEIRIVNGATIKILPRSYSVNVCHIPTTYYMLEGLLYLVLKYSFIVFNMSFISIYSNFCQKREENQDK